MNLRRPLYLRKVTTSLSSSFHRRCAIGPVPGKFHVVRTRVVIATQRNCDRVVKERKTLLNSTFGEHNSLDRGTMPFIRAIVFLLEVREFEAIKGWHMRQTPHQAHRFAYSIRSLKDRKGISSVECTIPEQQGRASREIWLESETGGWNSVPGTKCRS